MEVMALAQVMLRRWWLLLLFGVLGVCCAYLAVSVLPKRYQSAVSLQLNPSGKSALLPYTGSNSDQVAPSAVATLAASYSEVLRSRTFDTTVVNRLSLPIQPEELTRSIDAKLIPNTNILRLTVTWDQPQDAQQLASVSPSSSSVRTSRLRRMALSSASSSSRIPRGRCRRA